MPDLLSFLHMKKDAKSQEMASDRKSQENETPMKDSARQNVSQDEMSQKPKETIVHKISVDDSPTPDMPMKNVIIIFTLVIVAGIASGFGVSYVSGASGSSGSRDAKTNDSGTKTLSGDDDVVESAGIADKETFSDSAEGTLEKKTEDDFLEEGSYKLIRPGGESQTVHLTSSTVDMSKFVGEDVRVYGETFASEKVGWLMDVGFIEVKK